MPTRTHLIAAPQQHAAERDEDQADEEEGWQDSLGSQNRLPCFQSLLFEGRVCGWEPWFSVVNLHMRQCCIVQRWLTARGAFPSADIAVVLARQACNLDARAIHTVPRRPY